MINMKVLLLVIVSAAVSPVAALSPPNAFNVSLELQGDCSDQLTLICRHSDVPTDPNWLHNGTVEGGQVLSSAFPGAVYSVQSSTEHRVTISGVGNVQALDGYIIQCVYSIQGNLIKSNAVKYSFIPPDYRPALSLMSFTALFSERFCTFTYSYKESCNLYPRCTPYFSVEHTVSPQSAVSNSSSGCSVEYTIHNLMRCVSYQSTATALLPNQRGIPVVVGDTVMLSPSQFTITSVSIGVGRNFINVTYMENESGCPGYPTERYTVDVDGVQVADLTADAVQSLAINHANGSVTLFLPLNQPLPENAETLDMTKYNTVPTNRSDVKGNIVTEMVTWGTSAVFKLSQESSATMNDKVHAEAVSVGEVVGAIISVISVTTVVVVISIAVALVIARNWKAKECGAVDLKAAAKQRSGDGDHTSSSVVDQETGGIAGVVHIGQECNPRNGPKPTFAKATKNEEFRPSLSSGRMNRPPATKDRTRQNNDECVMYVHKCIQRQPKVDLKRGDTAGGVEPQETTIAFRDDASTRRDHVCDDHADSKQGQRTEQGLTYVTVDHSRPRPINAPNENLDVQYTGVKFDTKAPAV